MERSSILQARKYLNVQASESSERQFLVGGNLAIQFIQWGNIHIVQTILLVDAQRTGIINLAHRLGIIRAVGIHQVIVWKNRITWRKHTIVLSVILAHLQVSTQVKRKPFGEMRGIGQIDAQTLIVRVLVLQGIIFIGNRCLEEIVYRIVDDIHIVLLVQRIALGIFLHLVIVVIALACQTSQGAIHLCLRNITRIIIQDAADTSARIDILRQHVLGIILCTIAHKVGILCCPFLLQIYHKGRVGEIVRIIRIRMPSERGIERNIGLTLGGRLLGRDDDDTIGGTSTINRGCGSILQHGDALDVVHIEVWNLLRDVAGTISRQLGFLHRKTIDDIKGRSRSIHRGNTTYHTIIITSYLASQHGGKIAQSLVFQLIGSNLGKGTRGTFLRNGLIACHHYLAEHGLVLRHGYLQVVLAGYLYLLVVHTYIRDSYLVTIFRNVKLKMAIYIRYSSIRATRHRDRSTYHRFAIFVGDGTRQMANVISLAGCSSGRCFRLIDLLDNNKLTTYRASKRLPLQDLLHGSRCRSIL